MYLQDYSVYYKARDAKWHPGYPPEGEQVVAVSSVAGMHPAEVSWVKANLTQEQHEAAALAAVRRMHTHARVTRSAWTAALAAVRRMHERPAS